MKIVVLDGYTTNPGDVSWEPLARFGELIVYPRSETHEIISRIGDASIAFVSDLPMDAAVFAACPRLKFLGVLATGYNGIDVKAAGEHGVVVCNLPQYGTEAVSQYAFGLLLEICGRVGHHDEQVRAGRWQKTEEWCFWDYPLLELYGKTLGIVGLGSIGKASARKGLAFGMQVIAHSPTQTEEGRSIATYVGLDELLRESHVIMLHCPLNEKTAGIISREAIGKMRDGAILINNSRGGLVDEHALAEALNTGKLRAAGLDVLAAEPPLQGSPLLSAKNCFITPHISWAPEETRRRMVDCAAENLAAFLRGRPIHVVN